MQMNLYFPKNILPTPTPTRLERIQRVKNCENLPGKRANLAEHPLIVLINCAEELQKHTKKHEKA